MLMPYRQDRRLPIVSLRMYPLEVLSRNSPDFELSIRDNTHHSVAYFRYGEKLLDGAPNLFPTL